MEKTKPCEEEAVCEFSRVRLKSGGEGELDFCIRRGELWIVELPRGADRPDVAGAATGSTPVLEGRVSVLGCHWDSASVLETEAIRQRTGRVFDPRHNPVWLQNLDIEENLLLPHTISGAEPFAETMGRMHRIGEEFGFEEIPKSRPSVTGHVVTQEAQCVRAFMRKQLDFLVLEVPTRHAEDQLGEVLRRKLEEVMGAGCGVLWITDDSEIAECVPKDLAAGSFFYGKRRWTGDRDRDED